ncbi:unnamed protein product [Symbiodinium sp. KB8]|nr:unnamed protein product [Symbiodinium sp. KB8]
MVSNSRASGNVAESFIRGSTWAASLVILNTMHAERLGLRYAAQGAALAVYRQRRLWQEALQQFLQEGIFTLLTMKRMFSILADANQVGLLLAHRFAPGQQLQEKVMGAKFRAARWREACFLVASQRPDDTFFSVALLSNAVGACSRILG